MSATAVTPDPVGTGGEPSRWAARMGTTAGLDRCRCGDEHVERIAAMVARGWPQPVASHVVAGRAPKRATADVWEALAVAGRIG